MMRRITSVLTVLAFAGWASSAFAIPIITTETCFNDANFQCATGINDLVVGTDTFDVTFVQGSYNSIFASENPYFLDDEIGAGSAGVAIASLFNSNSPTMLWTAGQPVYILVNPYSYDSVSDTFSSNLTSSIDIGATYLSQNIGSGFDANIDPLIYEGFAVFELQSQSGVPTPATLGLFGLALASLGLTRRRKA